jgi:hypothetical protein
MCWIVGVVVEHAVTVTLVVTLWHIFQDNNTPNGWGFWEEALQ